MATKITTEEKSRHAKLLNDLANYFDPDLNKHEYDQLLNSCRPFLHPLVVKNSKNALDLFRNLERKGALGIGKYEELKKIIKEFDVTVIPIINEAEDDIAQLKSQVRAVPSPVQQLETDANPPSSRKPNLNVPTTITGGSESYPHSTGNTDMPTAPKRKRVDDDEYTYNTDGKTGLLVILNFTQYRAGTEEDENSLKDFFKNNLKWEVETRKDLKYDQLDRYLGGLQERLSDKETADKFYCLVVTVMSHGNKEGIFPHDCKKEVEEKRVYKYDSIFNFFKNDEMKAFAGKPKVFLVQACRGSQIQTAVPDDPEQMEYEESPPPPAIRIAIPVDADMLIMWATTPGFKAFRSELSGSHFLQEVVCQFKENYGTNDIENMLMRVRHTFAHTKKYRVSAVTTENEVQVSVQMPCTWTTLTKILYLK